jgi:hypothetical protein
MKKIFTFLGLIFVLFAISNDIFAKNIISGKLLKSNGKPLAYVEIELTPTNSETIIIDKNMFAVSGSNGAFIFNNVPKGNFALSINFNEHPTDLSPYETCFYPNTNFRAEAKVFETDINTRFTGLIFQLPPQAEKRKITGKVVWQDKKPAANSYVMLRDVKLDPDFFITFGNKADANGNFTLSAFENRKYQIIVVFMEGENKYGVPKAFVRSEIFMLDKTATPFDLTLKEINGSNKLLENDVGMILFHNSSRSANNFAG